MGNVTINNWFRHNVPRLGASLAFYTLLSLTPLLVVIVAIAGAVFGREAAEGQIVWQIQDQVGRDGAQAVQALLRGTQRPGQGAVATVLSILTLVFGATSVVSELRAALNVIWCVPIKEEVGLKSLQSVLVDRTMSFALVLGIGFLLLVSLAFNAAISALGKHELFPAMPAWCVQILDFVITYAVITLLFAVLFKVLPDLYIEWRDVFLGAAITSLLFNLGKTLIGIYLGTAGIASTYGAAGSLVVVLIWVYYSAQIFFLGAEFTQAFAQKFGSRPCDRVGREVRIVNAFGEPLQPQGSGDDKGASRIV
ncbi:MAG: YihY/virulence factor BrkB family protein [Bryobacteraceae bacterium]